MRTTTDADCYKHLENSLAIFKALEAKAERFDYAFRDKCVENRDLEALELKRKTPAEASGCPKLAFCGSFLFDRNLIGNS